MILSALEHALIGLTFHRATLVVSHEGARLASRRDMNPSFSLARSIARGIGTGIVATTTMTAGMFVFQKAGLLGRMPPRLLTERTLARLGLRRKTSRTSRKLLTALTHYGFGASMGAIFEVGKSALAVRLGRAPNALVLGSGVAFGTLVWIASYMGWVPAAGLMPRPSNDRPGRPTSMVLAHWIFGGTLGALGTRFASPTSEVNHG